MATALAEIPLGTVKVRAGVAQTPIKVAQLAAQLLALVFIFGAAQFALAAVQVALDASHGLLGIPHTAAITVAAHELWLQLRGQVPL